MVALKRSQISLIERFVAWPRGLGYVLDFSDRTFEEFFGDESVSTSTCPLTRSVVAQRGTI